MDVFALSLRLKEEGAAVVAAAIKTLRKSMDDATTDAKKMDSGLDALRGTVAKLGLAVGAGVIFKKFVDETSAAQFAQAQLASALKSTGYAAGQSITALNEHASALQKVTIFADDAVTEAQSLLLTFTKIQGDIFPKATQSVLDVAQAMGTDLKSAAIQVGKALNDPILGVSALARSGIQFTEQQKEQIKTLVESGKVVQAQTIILKELETQFGGSAAAARNTLGGALAGLKNAFGDLFEVSESGTSAVVTGLNNVSTALVDLKNKMDQAQVFPILIREIGLLVRAIGDTYAWFKMLGQQVDATGKIIDGFSEIVRGVGDLNRQTIQRGRDIAATGKAEYTALQERMTALIMESRARESATRAMSNYKSVLDGVLSGVTALNKAKTSAAADAVSTGEPAVPTLPKVGLSTGVQSTIVQPKLPVVAPGAVTIAPGVLANVRTQMDAVAAETERMAADVTQRLQQSFAGQIVTTFADALASGFEAAIATGKISEGFKAFGSVLLSGLGSMLQQFGTAALMANKLMLSLMTKMASMNPVAGIAAAVAIIALGGALKGAARSAFGGGGGGGGGGSYSAPAVSGGGTIRLPGLTYGPTMSSATAGMTAAAPVNVTIIGPNDPTAQRQMQELITNAQRRGSV